MAQWARLGCTVVQLTGRSLISAAIHSLTYLLPDRTAFPLELRLRPLCQNALPNAVVSSRMKNRGFWGVLFRSLPL